MTPAATPTLELTVIEAQDLKNPTYLGKMNPYVLVWLDPQHKRSTRTPHNPGKNPVWNQNLSFPLTPHILQNPNSFLSIQVLSSSPIHTKVIGSVILNFHQIIAIKETNPNPSVTLQLWRPSGRARGLLRVSFEFTGDLDFGYVDGRSITVEGIPLTSVSPPTFVPVVPSAPEMPYPENNARRSFWIGLLSGAVAAVLVGSSML